MSHLTRRTFLAGSSALILLPELAWAVPKVGAPAPVFTSTASTGQTVSLAEQKGKVVVLEWTNHDCPYVRKHYDSGNMQQIQKDATGQGIVWLTIISSVPGTQGHVSPGKADDLTKSRNAVPTAVLLDQTGAVGKMYGATNTPHMYVIDKVGTLVYMGAIDDRPTSRRSDVPGAQNYVRAALTAGAAGQPLKEPVTRAYGCTIKYA